MAISSSQYLSVYAGELTAIDASVIHLHPWLDMYVCGLLQQYSQIPVPPFKLSKPLGNKVLNPFFEVLFTRFITLKTPTQSRSKSSLLGAQVILVLVATKMPISSLIKVPKKETQFSTTSLPLLCAKQ